MVTRKDLPDILMKYFVAGKELTDFLHKALSGKK